MAKGKRRSSKPGKDTARKPPREIKKAKPVWPWVLGIIVVAVALFVVAGGLWQGAAPSTYNCFKLCYQRNSYDGASGVPFDEVLDWAEFNNERRIGFSFPPAGKVGFTIEAPPIGRLDYSIGLSKGAFRETERVEVIISFITENGRQNELERQSYDTRKADMAGRWHDRKVELPSHIGQGKLEIEVRGLSPDAARRTVFIGNPRIISLDERTRTRIILIAADALRADHLTCYGYERDTSPHIEALASEGTLFENCTVTSPWTFTSFGSIFTGKYPSSNGATIVSKLLPDDAETFAEILSRKGLLTCAVTNNVWFSPSFNLLQGFDSHRDFDNIAKMSLDYAKQWLFDNRDTDCVLFIHLIDPHLPYNPPGEYAKKYNSHYQGPYENYFDGVNDFRQGKLIITPPLNEHLIDLYDGEIAYMDNAIGQFFSALKATHMMEGTTIIFTADHGEEFLDHGSFEHGHSMYNELLHVPLIIKGAGYKPGERFDEVVSPIDLFATLLKRCGTDVPADVHAINLADVIKGDTGQGRNIYSEQIYYGDELSALTDGQYKYIYHTNDGAEELYDLTNDAEEKTNLADERRSVCRDRRKFVQNFIATHQAGFHVRFNRKHQGFAGHFAGTITCDAGIDGLVPDRLGENDRLGIEGNSIIFDIKLPQDTEKGFVFQVGDPSAEVVFDVVVDNNAGDATLVHIGAAKDVPGEVPFTLMMDDERFFLGQPVMLRASDPGMYIWAINPGNVESPWENLTSEEEERLRNLGYLSG